MFLSAPQKATSDGSEDGDRHRAGDGHVEAHDAAGGPEDDDGDEEGGRVGGAAAGQLHGPNSGAGESRALRRLEQSHQAVAHVQTLGGSAHGGVLPAGRPGEGARPGHQCDVRPAERDNREISGGLHRLHRASVVGDVGRFGTSGRTGHPRHAGGEPRLLPEHDSAVAAGRHDGCGGEDSVQGEWWGKEEPNQSKG